MQRLPGRDVELRTDEEDGTVALLEVGRPLRWRVKAGLVTAGAALGLASLALAMDPWHRGAATVGGNPQRQGRGGTELLHSLNSNTKDMGTILEQAFKKGDFEIYVKDISIFTVGDDIVILNTNDKASDNEEAVVKSIDGAKVTLVDALTQSFPAGCFVMVPADPVSGTGSHYHPPGTVSPITATRPVTTQTPSPAPQPLHHADVHPAVKILMVLLVGTFMNGFVFFFCYGCPSCESTPPKEDPTHWMFKPRDNIPVVILSAPHFEAEETKETLQWGQRIEVAETQALEEAEGGEGDRFWLKLADGRGWVVDREPGIEYCYQLFAEVNQKWLYQPEHAGRMPILEGPDIEGPRTGDRLQPGDKIYVSEIQAFDDGGPLFLKLADGRGWVIDQAQTDGELLCKRIVEETWVYQPANGTKAPMRVRASPVIDDKTTDKTDHRVYPGDQFVVDEIEEGETGILFLKLADGRGWVFDKHPHHGDLCNRVY